MRKTYQVLAFLIAISVVLQAMWIGLATFLLIGDLDDGKTIDKSYDGNWADGMHGLFGTGIIPLLAILLLIVSFFAKIPGGSKWAGYVFLAVVVQIVLAFLAFGVPALGFLHPVNAFVLMGVAATAGRRARLVGSAAAVPAETAPAV
ncbi:MAG TPA: hypothetical protein VH857_04905 [Actinomycetes bacterium]|nr:hypothetical protein [Actinomycetes bacterium]